MDNETFANEIATLVGETRGVEFKCGLPATDTAFVAVVARAMMAMSNRANGGRVIIGVSEDEERLHFNGLSDADLATWTPDDVADKVSRYADPPLQFELCVVDFKGNKFVVLDVTEFDDIPTIAKRAYERIIKEGAVYVRPRRKPESVPIPTATDMRDLLDLATEKLARRLLGQAERLGLGPTPSEPLADDSYRREATDLLP